MLSAEKPEEPLNRCDLVQESQFSISEANVEGMNVDDQQNAEGLELQQVSVGDLEVLKTFYHQKLQEAVSSPAYFCLNQVYMQLQQNVQDFKEKCGTHLVAPLAGKLLADLRITSYCIVCLRFIDAARREPRLPCPACQSVGFCSGFCSLEPISHPCAILRRLGRQALLLQPEIARLHLQACGTLKKIVQRKDQIILEANQPLQIHSFPPRQITDPQYQSNSALVKESDQFFRLSIQPIYNAIMANKQRLNIEGPDMDLSPSIDPFLIPYFLRSCQILSKALETVKGETKQLDTKCLELNRQLNNLQNTQTLWEAKLLELQQKNNQIQKISKPEILEEYFRKFKIYSRDLLSEQNNELSNMNQSPKKPLQFIYQNIKNKLLKLADDQFREQQKQQSQYQAKLQVKMKAQRDLNQYSVQVTEAEKRKYDAEKHQNSIKKILNNLKEQKLTIFNSFKRPLVDVLLQNADSFKDLNDLNAFLSKFQLNEEKSLSSAPDNISVQTEERSSSQLRRPTAQNAAPRSTPNAFPITHFNTTSNIQSTLNVTSPEPIQHSHIRQHKFNTKQIINEKYKQIRQRYENLQNEAKNKHVNFADQHSSPKQDEDGSLSRSQNASSDCYRGSRPSSAVSPSSRPSSRPGSRAGVSSQKRSAVHKVEVHFNLGSINTQKKSANLRPASHNSLRSQEEKLSIISDIENDARDIGRPNVVLPEVPDAVPRPRPRRRETLGEPDENNEIGGVYGYDGTELDDFQAVKTPNRLFNTLRQSQVDQQLTDVQRRPESAGVGGTQQLTENKVQSQNRRSNVFQRKSNTYITKQQAFAPDSRVSLKLEAQKTRNESAFYAGEHKHFTRAVIFTKKKPVIAREAELLKDQLARQAALEKNRTVISLDNTNNAAVFGLPVPKTVQITDRRSPALFAACHDAKRRLTTSRQLSTQLLHVVGNADKGLIQANYQNVKQVQQTGKYDSFVMDTQKTARAYKLLVCKIAAERRSYYINKMLVYTMAVNVFQQLEQDDQHYLRLSTLKKQFQIHMQRNHFAFQAKIRVLHKNFASSCRKSSTADTRQLGRNQRYRALMLHDTIAAAWRLPDVIRHGYYMQILQYIETGLGGEGLIT